jgi:hypothetical protein
VSDDDRRLGDLIQGHGGKRDHVSADRHRVLDEHCDDFGECDPNTRPEGYQDRPRAVVRHPLRLVGLGVIVLIFNHSSGPFCQQAGDGRGTTARLE